MGRSMNMDKNLKLFAIIGVSILAFWAGTTILRWNQFSP